MTPQERELVNALFDRLHSLESTPRDPEAERAIVEGASRAPHAIYALVQTVLVQDEALKRANARIQELEGTDASDSPRDGGSFLDNMRGALWGREPGARGSVPSVRTGAANEASAPPVYAPSPGGSFLGTAAAAAAGMIGGSLMLDGIRSMFGHSHSYAGAYEPMTPAHSPWDNGGAANSDLARQAGVDDIGEHRGHEGDQHSAGLFDSADADDSDDDFDTGGFDDGGDAA